MSVVYHQCNKIAGKKKNNHNLWIQPNSNVTAQLSSLPSQDTTVIFRRLNSMLKPS